MPEGSASGSCSKCGLGAIKFEDALDLTKHGILGGATDASPNIFADLGKLLFRPRKQGLFRQGTLLLEDFRFRCYNIIFHVL